MARRWIVFSTIGCCLCLFACAPGAERSSAVPASGAIVAEGTIVAREVSSFQYGSDLLLDRDGRVRYALRADGRDLAGWRGRAVRVSGHLVAGYPLAGGPPLLAVTAIEPANP